MEMENIAKCVLCVANGGVSSEMYLKIPIEPPDSHTGTVMVLESRVVDNVDDWSHDVRGVSCDPIQ